MGKPIRVVHIRWLDTATTRGWHAKSLGVDEIESVGILVKETPHTLSLSTSLSVEGGSFMDIVVIPKAVITDRRWVRVAPLRRRKVHE